MLLMLILGVLLGIGIGSFLCYVYISVMLTGTIQTLSEKEPKQQEAVS